MSRASSLYLDSRPISKRDLSKLPLERQQEVMRFWFYENYEEPDEDNPYMHIQEGGHIFTWGGPYTAKEILMEEFSYFIDQETIQDLIEEIEADGALNWVPIIGGELLYQENDIVDGDTEWPPNVITHRNISDYEDILNRGVQPRLGSKQELEQRAEVLKRVTELEAEIQKIKNQPSMMGHNNPPEPIDTQPIININIEKIEFQMGRAETPAVQEVIKSTKFFRDFSFALSKFVGKKIDHAVTLLLTLQATDYFKKNPDTLELLFKKTQALYESLMQWFSLIF